MKPKLYLYLLYALLFMLPIHLADCLVDKWIVDSMNWLGQRWSWFGHGFTPMPGLITAAAVLGYSMYWIDKTRAELAEKKG